MCQKRVIQLMYLQLIFRDHFLYLIPLTSSARVTHFKLHCSLSFESISHIFYYKRSKTFTPWGTWSFKLSWIEIVRTQVMVLSNSLNVNYWCRLDWTKTKKNIGHQCTSLNRQGNMSCKIICIHAKCKVSKLHGCEIIQI